MGIPPIDGAMRRDLGPMGTARKALITVAVAYGVLVAQPAQAGVITSVPRPTPVTSYAGYVLWSEFDPVSERYRLRGIKAGSWLEFDVRTRAAGHSQLAVQRPEQRARVLQWCVRIVYAQVRIQ